MPSKKFCVSFNCKGWQNAKFYYVGKLYLVNFFQFNHILFSTKQAVESAKPPEKYTLADSTFPVAQNFFQIKLELFTSLF